MRDAAVGAYPWLRFILPQYAMVPPPPVPTTQLGNKPATSAASKPPNANLEHKQSFVVSIPESNEKNSDAFKESDET
ncbi:unnamed protein product [Nippostrongylus brasiliensis]|uniref:Ovule protein n=1 Tax=Nippostrongylus brasiliensis TaxID=27835 RepID=A0A0N4XY95_NIPBR|nr:unnamed protein product [Nippostrongylus brasiliensis]